MKHPFGKHGVFHGLPVRWCWVRAVLVLLVIFLGCHGVDACPGCKDALAENDPQHAQMVRGYFWSILFMMAMPFALAGTFGTFCYLEIRRKRAEQKPDEMVD